MREKGLRQVQRACDPCRTRKVRCDGPAQASRVCTLCTQNSTSCTYHGPSFGRYEPPKAYVAALEQRLRKVESLLHGLLPNVDLSKDIDKLRLEDIVPRRGVVVPQSEIMPKPPPPSTIILDGLDCGVPARAGSTYSPTDDDYTSSDDDGSALPLEDPLHGPVSQKIYVGKSSSVRLLNHAFSKAGDGGANVLLGHARWRRPKFWSVPLYENRDERALAAKPFEPDLPPPDLLHTLVETFFQKFNPYWALLHKGLFMTQLWQGLYRVDRQFYVLVLLVCALASRMINDPRVLLDPSDVRSAGWTYFEMAESMNKVHLSNGTLLDMQTKVLTVFFRWGSSILSAAWTALGVNISFALQCGAHRKKFYQERPNLNDELWKRAFWTLYWIDRDMSATLGRPCMIQDESFDLELPLEVDDDCWDISDPSGDYLLKHPQPQGRPSTLVYLTSEIRLCRIMSFTMRTIHSIRHPAMFPGILREHWESKMLDQIDRELRRWPSTVPEHLRWNPKCDNPIWFKQGTALTVHYNLARIFAHVMFMQLPTSRPRPPPSPPRLQPALPESRRPSTRSTGSASTLSSPGTSTTSITTAQTSVSGSSEREPSHSAGGQSSRAICIDAARVCLEVISTNIERTEAPHDMVIDYMAQTTYYSSMVLLLGAWTADAAIEDAQEFRHAEELLRDVDRCLDILKHLEKYWQPAGKCWDVVNELAHADASAVSSSLDASIDASPPSGPERPARVLRSFFMHHAYEPDADETNGPDSGLDGTSSPSGTQSFSLLAPMMGTADLVTAGNPLLDIAALGQDWSLTQSTAAPAEQPGATDSCSEPTPGLDGGANSASWLGANMYGWTGPVDGQGQERTSSGSFTADWTMY